MPTLVHILVNKSAEMLWIDSIEADQRGDREKALALAEEVVAVDGEHSDAWMAVAEWGLPTDSRGRPLMPDLAQSSKSMSAVKKVVSLDPQNEQAWRLGGEIIVSHLGMLEHGLHWWEERKETSPNDVVPYFEQAGILIRLGCFDEAEECLNSLDDLVSKQPSKSLESRSQRLRLIFEEQLSLEKEVSFSPENSKDESWGLISRMRKKKPISETYFLLMFVMPIVFLLGTLVMMFLGGTRYGTGIVMVFIILLYFWIARISRRLLLKLNRPEAFLNRALDVESTSGKVCIPEDVRSSKLYSYVIGKRLPSFQQRIELIEESSEALPSKWSPTVPVF